MQIKGGVFLITGGASGLGEATASLLIEQGASVTLLDIKETEGVDTAARLGARCLWPGETDITSEESVQAAIDATLQKFGKLSGAVNCAGIGMAMKTVGNNGYPHSLDVFESVLRINLIGTFNVCRLASAVMSKQTPNEDGERGVIINVASVAAFEGQIGQVAYSASKAGVVGMTLTMARDLCAFGIRVVTIAPGVFETPMMALASKKVVDGLTQANAFPKRLGRPAEFAKLAAGIIENTMINGETIRIDAGVRMPRM